MEEAIYLKRYRMKNRKWKEFKLAELFQVKRGKRLVESDRIPGMRPLITAGFHNSGIASFIANSEQEIFPKSTITIDMFANAFYRNYSYSADDNILVLINDDISENCKLFITTVFDNANQFSYGKQYRLGNFKRQKIMLPVTNNGTPDWAFMEEYVQIKYNQIKDTYKFPEQHEILDFREIDEVEWGEFLISDYFDVNKERGSESNMDSLAKGNLPLISAKKFGNGLKGFVETEPRKIKSSNVITWNKDGDGGAGLAYYQEFKFAVDSHVFVLYAKFPANKYNQLFIVTLLSKYKEVFNHGRANSLSRYKAEKIMLPSKDGLPDFVFMEQYMKRLENRIIKNWRLN